MFTHLVFKISVGRIFRTVYGIVFFASLLAILILPYGTVDLQISYFTIFPIGIAFAVAVRSKRTRENPYTNLFLIALGAVFLWAPFSKIVINDALYAGCTVSFF